MQKKIIKKHKIGQAKEDNLKAQNKKKKGKRR